MLAITYNLRYASCLEEKITDLLHRSGNDCPSHIELGKYRNLSVKSKYYHKFQIPKKSGGTRTIIAPVGELKEIQSAIAKILSSSYYPEECVNGFVEGKSVVTNAGMHLDRNYILNVDLKDFFPGITAEMVRNALLANGVGARVAAIVATVCTLTDECADDFPMHVLPQGAPTSPVLSNIVCQVMDNRLSGLARRFGLTYSRYADDITFSSHHSVYSKGSLFWQELESIISECGFSINENKTRLLKKGARQEVTGITVGKKLNVSRKWLKNLRAAIFQMEMHGVGRKEEKRIRGKLSYLKMVRGEDETYRRLQQRFLAACISVPFLEQHMKKD